MIILHKISNYIQEKLLLITDFSGHDLFFLVFQAPLVLITFWLFCSFIYTALCYGNTCKYKKIGYYSTCELRASTVKCQSILSINTLDWHLNQHPDWYPVDTWSTLDQQSVDIVGWMSTDSYCMHQSKVSGHLTWLSTEMLMECQSRCDQEYYSRVLTDTWPWMPLHVLHMIRIVTSQGNSLFERLQSWHLSSGVPFFDSATKTKGA